MKISSLLLIAVLVISTHNQSCEVQQALRTDCGYMGINQQLCESKGCCWKPARLQEEEIVGDAPWCFFKSGTSPCQNITWSWTGGPGFDEVFYDKMYALFDANIDILGKGGIVASPDRNTPGGSYYFHWMRDAGLTMRTYMEINNFKLSVVEKKMKSYVDWIIRVQGEIDPNGYDIRINPKFQLPNGEVFMGGWCRPQTDGPGLRSAALLVFGDLLLKEGQLSYVTGTLIKPIKFDLEYVFEKWTSDGCDLWEQVRSNDFFWNRNAYVYALTQCESLFTKLGDSSFASKCSAAKSAVKATLDSHWTGSYMTESTNRQKDSAVIHAFSSFEAYPITDAKVAKTIQVLAITFCGEYAINQQDNKANIPGMLMGRYPGDSYAGGNPWQLLTAVLAKIFYQGANYMMETNGFLKEQDKIAWFDLLKIPQSAGINDQVRAAIEAGDSVMYRLFKYVKADGGHIAEQIGRNSGAQTSAKDLTWSFANIMSAMREREKAKEGFSKLLAKTSEILLQ